MNGTCFECKFMRNRTDLEPCEQCTNTFAMTGEHPSFTPKKPPITNYDRLTHMSINEFATWLTDFCCATVGNAADARVAMYHCGLREWLEQEATK